jgi:arylsulfatase A-like enzyme
VRDAWTPDQVTEARGAYHAALKHLDSKLAELFGQLEARGLLSNTVVVVTSDHGEEFYEHGVMGHGNSIHVQGLAVPLIVVWPGHIPAGRVVESPVSTRQLPATILGLLGETAVFPGPSLAQSWLPEAADTRASTETLRFEVRYAPRLPASYPVSGGTLTAVLQSGFWHLASPTGKEELYDAVGDQSQTRDLLADPGYTDVLNRMRRVHEEVMPEWFEPPSSARGPAVGPGSGP